MNEFLKKDLLPFFNNSKSLLDEEDQKQNAEMILKTNKSKDSFWNTDLLKPREREVVLPPPKSSFNKESLIHNQNYVDQQKLIKLAQQEYYKTGCLYGSANMHRHLEDKVLHYHDSSGHEFSCCNHCATEFLQLFTLLDMKLRLKQEDINAK